MTSPFKAALQHGVCELVRGGCAYVCHVESQLVLLRASLMYVLKRAYGLPCKMATFVEKKGLFNTVYCVQRRFPSVTQEKHFWLSILHMTFTFKTCV